MITFYYNAAPNPMKVALFLEEAGLPYEAVPVDSRKGEQHAAAYTAINPNAKLPAIVDGDATVFDSNAILLYLAEKTGKFIPEAGDKARGELYSWLMFVATGIGPYSGQAVHFRHFAPKSQDYALNRYAFEALRHWGIVDARLKQHRYMLGETYSIVDMAVWGWARMVPFVMGEDAWEKLPNLKRLQRGDQRPSGRATGRGLEEPAQLQGRNGRRGQAFHVPPERRLSLDCSPA